MNRLFIAVSILITFISFFIAISQLFNSEVGFSPEFEELKNFRYQYPEIAKTGFISDNTTSEYFFYKAQNSVIPVFVFENEKLNHIICFEEKNHGFCRDFCKYNDYKILKEYSDDLFLLKKEAGVK